MDIIAKKNELRKEAKVYRGNLSEDDRLNKSTKIISNLKGLEVFQKADVVLMYASLQGEVETLKFIQELLEEGKKEIYCPVTRDEEMDFYRIQTWEDLKEGNFRVLEPKAMENKLLIPQKDIRYCIIMPGLMFDKMGNRLGYGKGYYDKYLAKLPEDVNVIAIALSYEAMVKDEIPAEETDRRVDYIVTEERVYIS